MLHIVFVILKILGIILSVILAIALLFFCSVLFVPLRYKINADAIGDIDRLKIRGKYHWFFHIVSGRFVFDEGLLVGELKFLGKKLDLNETQQDKGTEEETKAKKKKRSFWEKIEYTFYNIYDRIKVFIRTVEKMDDFLNDETHRRAWKCLKKQFFCLLKAIKPKEFKIDLLLGAEDPAYTGQLLAVLSMIYPFFPETTNITPDFTRRVFEGEMFARGKVRGIHLLKILWTVLVNQDIKTTFEDLEKLRRKK